MRHSTLDSSGQRTGGTFSTSIILRWTFNILLPYACCVASAVVTLNCWAGQCWAIPAPPHTHVFLPHTPYFPALAFTPLRALAGITGGSGVYPPPHAPPTTFTGPAATAQSSPRPAIATAVCGLPTYTAGGCYLLRHLQSLDARFYSRTDLLRYAAACPRLHHHYTTACRTALRDTFIYLYAACISLSCRAVPLQLRH